jgi:colicin import membrane protein
LQIQALQDQLARQSAEIEKQRAQVEDAKRQVQDIAIKAIEVASGAQALSHIDKMRWSRPKPAHLKAKVRAEASYVLG